MKKLTVDFLLVNGVPAIVAVGAVGLDIFGIAKDARGSRPAVAVFAHETKDLGVPLLPPAGGEIGDVDDCRVGVIKFPAHFHGLVSSSSLVLVKLLEVALMLVPVLVSSTSTGLVGGWWLLA